MAAAVMADQFLETRVARLESDVATIRSNIDEMKVDIRGIRIELSEVRGEVHKLDTSMRAEIHGLDTALRAQVHGLDTSLRGEVAKVREDIASLDHKLTRNSAYNKVWMLLQIAAVLGVIARAFKWL